MIDNIKQGEIWLRWAGEKASWWWWSEQVLCFACFGSELCYRSMIFPSTDFNIQEEKARYFIPWLWNSKATNCCNACLQDGLISELMSLFIFKMCTCMGFLATDTIYSFNSMSGYGVIDYYSEMWKIATILLSVWLPIHIEKVYYI